MAQYRRRGVPKGYRHIWKYKGKWDEVKTSRGWKIDFRATKRRRHKGMGGFGVGTKGAWMVKGIQYIRKTGRDTYQTRLIGRKYPLKFHVKRVRRQTYAST